MTYEKEPYGLDEIPDYALQPARPADKDEDAFDPSIYERLLQNTERLRNASLESQPKQKTEEVNQVRPSGLDDENRLWQELMHLPAMEPEEQDASVPVNSPATDLADQEVLETEDATDVDLEEAEKYIEPVDNFAEVTAPQFDEEPYFAVMPEPEKPQRDMKTVPTSPVEAILPKPVSGSDLFSSKLPLAEINKGFQVQVSIEEDILVPDTKPDLAYVVAMDGKAKLVTKDVSESSAGKPSLKLSGDFILQTLYVPHGSNDQDSVISIESRLPFRSETELRKKGHQELIVVPSVERVDYSVVNERKFRVRALVNFNIREYSQYEIDLFEGIKGEDLQLLKEKIQLTDVAARKRDLIEIREDLHIKDTMPEILKILKYDVNVVESHRNISKDKAVINASVYCNIMYLGADLEETYGKTEDAQPVSAGSGLLGKKPVLYQGRTEFTHFIKLADGDNPEGQAPAASKAYFDILSLNLSPKEDVNGHYTLFDLDMDIETSLEIYKNVEKEVVADAYHHQKEIKYETSETMLSRIFGSGVSELSVREIINIPERYGPIDSVAFISGKIIETDKSVEGSKSMVEGAVEIGLICVAADDKKTTFSVKQQIPFKNLIDIPGVNKEMQVDNELVLKDLWFDKINNRQVEVNGAIVIKATAMTQENHQFIKNVSFAELSQEEQNSPSIILYITKSGDNLWKVAKKYRTTMEDIQKINHLGQTSQISPGTKLLISRSNVI